METTKRQHVWRAATVLIPIAAAIAVWHFADLSSYKSAQDVAQAINRVAERPGGWALVPLGFAAGSMLFVPVNALIAGVTLSFPPLQGFLFAMAGGLIGAFLTYFVGILFGTSVVELLRGPRVDQVVHKLRRNPFRTSLVLHLLPIGNFTAVNLLAGALRVPLGGFMLGTTLGLLPGVIFFAFLAGQLPGLLKNPRPLSIALLVAGLLAAVVLGFVIKRLVKRPPSEHVPT